MTINGRRYMWKPWVQEFADVAALSLGFLSFAALAVVAAELFQ